MRCSSCGTNVDDGLDVCPACHAPLQVAGQASEREIVWCGSCGSPIPVGRETCPVCGMPADGVYDDDAEELPGEGSASGDSDEEGTDRPLSAIPPTPHDGNEELEEDAGPRRVRLLLLAAVASIVLIGGTALYISRPWNPNAYVTHATEDADTSMEGFPGTVTHLRSQDLVEDEELRSRMREAGRLMEELNERMDEQDSILRAQLDALGGYAANGIVNDAQVQYEEANQVVRYLEDQLAALQAYDLNGAGDLEDAQKNTVLLATYQLNSAQTIYDAWSIVTSSANPAQSMLDVRNVLNEGVEGTSAEAWLGLYENLVVSQE